jgi:hypothetical protein
MRTFYEEWSNYFKSVATAAEILEDENQGDEVFLTLQSTIRSPLANELKTKDSVAENSGNSSKIASQWIAIWKVLRILVYPPYDNPSLGLFYVNRPIRVLWNF